VSLSNLSAPRPRPPTHTFLSKIICADVGSQKTKNTFKRNDRTPHKMWAEYLACRFTAGCQQKMVVFGGYGNK
jgi:hypothetical protein